MAKKCKICKKVNPTPMQKTCSYDCANAYLKSPEGVAAQNKLKESRIKRLQARERRHQRERKEGIRPLSEWLKLAQKEFNRYIRLRDKGQPCISCGRFHEGQYHAGHYRSVGGAPSATLRFEPLNCHLQCAPCNNHLSGNLIPYRVNLEIKIGKPLLAWLEGDHDPYKYTIDEVKAIQVKYRKMANELKKLDD